MPAVIQLHRFTGPGPTPTSIFGTDVRSDGRDAPDDQLITAYPVPFATLLPHWSYWAAFQLFCAVAPVTLVSNFRLYGTGLNQLGPNLDHTIAQGTAYTQAFGSGNLGTLISNISIPSLIGTVQPFSIYTSVSPFVLSGSTSVVGYFGNILYMQAQIGPGAPGGPSGQSNVWVEWDET